MQTRPARASSSPLSPSRKRRLQLRPRQKQRHWRQQRRLAQPASLRQAVRRQAAAVRRQRQPHWPATRRGSWWKGPSLRCTPKRCGTGLLRHPSAGTASLLLPSTCMLPQSHARSPVLPPRNLCRLTARLCPPTLSSQCPRLAAAATRRQLRAAWRWRTWPTTLLRRQRSWQHLQSAPAWGPCWCCSGSR